MGACAVQALIALGGLALLGGAPQAGAQAAGGSAAVASPWPAAGERSWQFQVLLDDQPIGQHVFRLSPVAGEAGAYRLVSEASYRVKLLGLTVYRYSHQAQELWRANCLAELQARTDDNGQLTQVRAQPDGTALRVSVQGAEAGPEQRAEGCMMSYAYWHPGLRGQARLLNPQTGRLDRVTLAAAAARGPGLGPVVGAVTGAALGDVRDWRIHTPQGPVDLRYQPDGAWVGLDALVQGRYRLSYRLSAGSTP